MSKTKVTEELFANATKMREHGLPLKVIASILGVSTATISGIDHATDLNDYLMRQRTRAAHQRRLEEATFLPGDIFGSAQSNIEEIELDYPEAIAEEVPVVDEMPASELALLQSVEREIIGMRACLASIANLLRAANQKNGVREIS